MASRGVVAVFDGAEVGGEVAVVGQAARLAPFLHETPHLGPLVGVAGGGIAQVGAIGPAAEIDAHQVRAAELGQPVVHAPADAGAVDEHRIGLVEIDLLHHAAGDLHQVGDAELHGRDRARVEPAAEADDALVAAQASGDVDAHDQRRRRILHQLARPGRVDPLAVDELQRAGAREDAAHAHADEIGILAVVAHPGLDLRLVGHRHRARIDLLPGPAMGEAAAGEAFAEAPGVARRVAEHRPRTARCRNRSARPRSCPRSARGSPRPRRAGRRRGGPCCAGRRSPRCCSPTR